MIWLDAYNLISHNFSFDKVVINDTIPMTLTQVVLLDCLSDDTTFFDKCDIYIKVNKTDCAKKIRDNKSLDITKFKQKQCKMNYDVCVGEPGCATTVQFFPKDSEIVDNTSQYFILKFTLKNINRQQVWNQYDKIKRRLICSCTDCLRKRWEPKDVKKWLRLHAGRLTRQSRDSR